MGKRPHVLSVQLSGLGETSTWQAFDPVLAWARDKLGASLEVDNSIFGAHQPEEAVDALRQHLNGALQRRVWCDS